MGAFRRFAPVPTTRAEPRCSGPGAGPGSNSVQATATTSAGQPLVGSPLSFSALAVEPPPASLVLRVAPSDAAQNEIPFERQPVVEVLDADLIPVPGVDVLASIASGGGTLGGATTVSSDASGRATYTNLTVVGATGPRTLRFSVAAPALEVASGTIQVGAGAPSKIIANAPAVYEGSVSSPVGPAPSVTVTDRAGNAVPGIESGSSRIATPRCPRKALPRTTSASRR